MLRIKTNKCIGATLDTIVRLPVMHISTHEKRALQKNGIVLDYKFYAHYFPEAPLFYDRLNDRILLAGKLYPVTYGKSKVFLEAQIEDENLKGQLVMGHDCIWLSFMSWDKWSTRSLYWMHIDYYPFTNTLELHFCFKDRNYDLSILCPSIVYHDALKTSGKNLKITLTDTSYQLSVLNRLTKSKPKDS